MTDDDLIMYLTHEQGGTRSTQVQPPIGVWERYFHIASSALRAKRPNPPWLTLVRRRGGASVRVRPVVSHDHNWTVEIRDARAGSILRLRRVGRHRYEYWVLSPGTREFDHSAWLLRSFPNPVWTRGRLWLVI